MKLKTLPSLKERKRYIAFKVISQEPINYSNLEAAIWNTALEFLGEEGVSKTSMWLVKNLYNEKEQVGVIKCNSKATQAVIACLGLIQRLGDIRVILKILKVSGTIKGLKINKLNK
jgi:ribonuclease P/MRP protein subunit POP5